MSSHINRDDEDEFHFVMQCHSYDELRTLLLRTCRGDAVLALMVGCHLADDRKRFFNLLMASSRMARALAKFTSGAFKLRETIIAPEQDLIKFKPLIISQCQPLAYHYHTCDSTCGVSSF
jgi:hypothetical protein